MFFKYNYKYLSLRQFILTLQGSCQILPKAVAYGFKRHVAQTKLIKTKYLDQLGLNLQNMDVDQTCSMLFIGRQWVFRELRFGRYTLLATRLQFWGRV